MKDLLVQLRNICNGLEDKNEIAIMKRYSCNANRYTTVLTSKIIFLNFQMHIHYLDWTYECKSFNKSKRVSDK